jgi:radical SAM superfamily enzyme YgiQ (UPF0313 family)
VSKNLLLINPWAYDFAAYDLWARPLGFLYLAAVLRDAGYHISYVDCMDRAHPRLRRRKDTSYGCGKYHEEVIEKPHAISWIKRYYRRFGLPLSDVLQELAAVAMPDAILVTSRMTYWYPAVGDIIRICRERFPGKPIILGGTYATLCPEHARRFCRPDYLLAGECEYKVLNVLSEIFQSEAYSPSQEIVDLDALPLPAYDLLFSRSALPVVTSRGCPKSCTYCAANVLFPAFRQRDPECVAAELAHHYRMFNTRDFAFYDDALLADGAHFEFLLDSILESGIRARFHCPNGLDFTLLTPAIASKMFQCGFKTVRLSLETAHPKRLTQLGRCQSPEQFVGAVETLRNAGFASEQIGVYIMVGLPNQNESEVRETIDFVMMAGAAPKLTEYSPIPGTLEWQRAVENATVDMEEEPLLHNNSVYYLLSRSLEPGAFERLKTYARNKKDGRTW